MALPPPLDKFAKKKHQSSIQVLGWHFALCNQSLGHIEPASVLMLTVKDLDPNWYPAKPHQTYRTRSSGLVNFILNVPAGDTSSDLLQWHVQKSRAMIGHAEDVFTISRHGSIILKQRTTTKRKTGSHMNFIELESSEMWTLT